MGNSNTIRNTFTKSERLKSKNRIEILFKEGISKRIGCVKMIYLITDRLSGAPVQVMFSVPRKQFRKAVQRNLLKRRMREAYRLNKKNIFGLFGKEEKQLQIAFIFASGDEESYHTIENNLKQLLSNIPHTESENITVYK